ncbi:hypothetical protein K502DRAFT_364664 [Neoconidiobolus thromboides FSU 785]|nr:hypothetical protein K502DRAFT_364664 [Neoconidiobolus thromboides FSU 785]
MNPNTDMNTNETENEEIQTLTRVQELLQKGGIMLPSSAVKPPLKDNLKESSPESTLPQYWYPLGAGITQKMEPMDITSEGTIYLRERPSIRDKADETIGRIWEESSISFDKLTKDNFINKFTENGDTKSDVDVVEEEEEEEEEEFTTDKFLETITMMKRRLLECKQEAGITYDMVNLLKNNPTTNPQLSLEDLIKRGETSKNPMPLAPNALDYSFGALEEPSLKRKIGDSKLNLAAKRSQIVNSVELLKQGEQRLKLMIDSEALFWSKMFKLKPLGWVIQSTLQRLDSNLKPFTVNYGYRDAGSTFNVNTVAELTHDINEAGAVSVRPFLEHQIPKTVILQLIGENYSSLKDKIDSNFIIPFQHPLEPLPNDWDMDLAVLKIHRTLQLARSTCLDLELFHHLTKEARDLESVIKTTDDLILIRINDQVDLAIRYVPLPKSYIDELNQTIHIKNGNLNTADVCQKIKVTMYSQLRIIHQNRLIQRKNKLMKNIVYDNEPPLEEIKKFEKVSPILSTNIDLCKYHFFLRRMWKETIKALSEINLPELPTKAEIPRIEADLALQPGAQLGCFTTSHYITIVVLGAHIIQFHLSAPNKLVAHLYSGDIEMDIEMDWFKILIKNEVLKILKVHDMIEV